MIVAKNEIIDAIGNIDLYICTSGFESRSMTLTLLMDSKLVNKAIAFHQLENYTISSQNLKRMEDHLKAIERIELPKNSPFETFEIIISKIDDVVNQIFKNKKVDIVVDMTAFTREVLLILLKVLTVPYIQEKTDVKFVYLPAKDYQEDWLTRGVRSIRSILGYSGLISPSKSSLLVMLTGFEGERMRTIIDTFESPHVLLGRPCEESSINTNLFSKSESKYIDLKKEYASLLIEDGFTFSCQDIMKTKKIVLDINNKYKRDYNIIIAPLNNKISTLGVAFAALEQENIQICYSSANQYNINNYSEECDFFYLYSINDYL